jgi:hypothetical protein
MTSGRVGCRADRGRQRARMIATAAQTQDVDLRNGATVSIRPVTADDEAAIFELPPRSPTTCTTSGWQHC